jgi:alpha-tubulin suppressor-like RCC1 family protein
VRALYLAVSVAIAGCGRVHFAELSDASGQADANACATPSPGGSCIATPPMAQQLAVGQYHACAGRKGGRVDCWGNNTDGQLGFCMTTAGVTTATATYAFDVAQLALGASHSCARLADGSAWCWGSRYEGETANGISTASDPIAHQVPGTWIDLATRRYHTCGIDSTGALWCWGRDVEGELGDGGNTDTATPQRVGTANDWQTVRAGGSFTCGLRAGGVAWCWGDNTTNQLGDGTVNTSNVPVQVMYSGGLPLQRLALGKQHACALDTGGSVWCWGFGMSGELGNGKIGATANEAAPFQVAGTFTQLATGWFQTCAIDTAGALWCWGEDANMTLFPGVQTMYDVPTMVDPGPWAEVEAGSYLTCARSAAGAVSCWGDNAYGQVGDGDTMIHSTPIAVCFGS